MITPENMIRLFLVRLRDNTWEAIQKKNWFGVVAYTSQIRGSIITLQYLGLAKREEIGKEEIDSVIGIFDQIFIAAKEQNQEKCRTFFAQMENWLVSKLNIPGINYNKFS